MGRYSLHLGPAFFKTVRGFTSAERAEVRRILRLIQLDPSIDGVHKFLLSLDAPFTTYVSPELYIFYYLQGSTIFVVDAERTS